MTFFVKTEDKIQNIVHDFLVIIIEYIFTYTEVLVVRGRKRNTRINKHTHNLICNVPNCCVILLNSDVGVGITKKSCRRNSTR